MHENEPFDPQGMLEYEIRNMRTVTRVYKVIDQDVFDRVSLRATGCG